jgi:hypothetical protein
LDISTIVIWILILLIATLFFYSVYKGYKKSPNPSKTKRHLNRDEHIEWAKIILVIILKLTEITLVYGFGLSIVALIIKWHQTGIPISVALVLSNLPIALLIGFGIAVFGLITGEIWKK